MRKIIVLSMITLDGVVMQYTVDLKKIHQAISNMVVGLHLILMSFMVRSWKNR